MTSLSLASGFGEHGHDNMEILTWVLEGRLHHRDSTGSDGDLRPGELQAMTAGRGIRHSEVNDSPNERVHLLQIWIEPDTLNLPPSYGQKSFAAEGRQAKWQTLASPDGRDGSMQIHQDATLQVTDLSKGQTNSLELGAGPACVRACGVRCRFEWVTRRSNLVMRSHSAGRNS